MLFANISYNFRYLITLFPAFNPNITLFMLQMSKTLLNLTFTTKHLNKTQNDKRFCYIKHTFLQTYIFCKCLSSF